MGIINRIFILPIVILLISMGLFPASIANAVDFRFDQGEGYEVGAYDREAAQPTAFNWARQSRFTGSPDHDLKWEFEAEDRIYSTPVVGSDDMIYVGSYDGNLYALDSKTGKLKWTFKTGFAIASSPAIGADGTIYLGSGDGKLYALDPHAAADDEREKWSFATGDRIYSSPAIGKDGTIYVSSYDGWLYALDPNANDENRVRWSYKVGGETDSSPAIGADGTVYIGSGEGFFYALDPNADDTHRLKWSIELNMEWDGLCWDEPCPIYSSPAIGADGTIYVGSDDGYVYALDPDADDEEERIKWSYETWGAVSSSPAIGADGTVYVGSFDGTLYALDPSAENDDEREKWSFETATNPWTAIISSPVVGADGTIYIGSGDKKLYALDPNAVDDEREKWSFSTEGEIYSSPVIGPDGAVYIGSYDHHLYAIGTRSIAIPDHVAATASKGAVELSWEDVDGAVGYQVYMYKGAEAPVDPDEWILVNDELITKSNYTAKGLEAGQLYWFAVKAVDGGGLESDFSELVSVTIPRSSSGGGSGGSSGGSYVSSNASLKTLEVWTDGKQVPLEPTFTKDRLSYQVETEATQIEIIAFAEHSAAQIIWQDKAVDDGIEIELKEGKNVISFSVQAEDGTQKTYTLTIERTNPQPVEPELPEISFTDIASHWAENYIEEAVMKNIVNGYPNGTFRPDDPVTRAEFTVMLVGSLKLEGKGDGLKFSDHLQIGTWAERAVAQAVKAGIINGYEDGSFRPNAKITRAEMAVMLARAMNLQLSENPSTTFADDKDIPQWAKSSIEAIHQLEIINGRSGNRFVPKEFATRAEATVVLLRMLEREENE